MESLFIKGTCMATREMYYDDPTCLGSYLLCAMESWVRQNFENTGEFKTDYPNEIKKKYGEVRVANDAFQNDIHNLSISYHQMKHVLAQDQSHVESGLKTLYLGNLVEHYMTNVRSIYDQMAVFARTVVDHQHLPLRNVSQDSLNKLITFLKNNEERATEIFSAPMVKQILSMETSLETVKIIRDAIIHDGKEPVITLSSGIAHIRINKHMYNREESLLPDLLNLGVPDYPLFPYLHKITSVLFMDIHHLGEQILNCFFIKDEKFPFEFITLIGVCMPDFVSFLNGDQQKKE
ncbi:hypothetical protein DU508_05485 [Pedobacter chinensis]|uniref:Uncharacterized protein n=1 Tax=Pedobacter chinensis TaxID=2282421 RepID=A0A369PVY7_9SPHI|nr:hypothetical protein [Pedobacter chinensis]RDC56664.1 hypothetical protein DU508_05485 [Pedobacter chinensis]